jgi:cell division protein FtsW
MGIGLVLVYSASFVFASETYGDALYFFKRQIVFVTLALAALGFASLFPYNYLKKFFWFFFVILILTLGAVFVPGLGHRVGGALRWISLSGGLRFEPGELAKLMSPVIFSYLLTYERNFKKDSPWKFPAIVGVVAFLPIFMMMRQPDFGSSVICFMVGATLLFCFGFPWRYLFVTGVIAVPTLYALVMHKAYRRQRVLAFLDPWADPSNGGFQVIQSILSLHAGGFWGVGIGKGQAKLFFLPEAHTDFILAVLGEETGLVGLICVLLLFAWIIYRGIQISLRCNDPFGKRLALGMSALIAFQALINTGVVTGLLPTKGLTMPFLSYGGSSLVAVSLACGVLINIHSRSRV